MKKVKISALRPKSVAEVLALGVASIPVAIPTKGTFRIDLHGIAAVEKKYVVIYSGENELSIGAVTTNLSSNRSVNSGDLVNKGTSIEITAIPLDTDDDVDVEWDVAQDPPELDCDSFDGEVPSLDHTNKDYLIAELNLINKNLVLDGTIPVSVGPITYCITLRDLIGALLNKPAETIENHLFVYEVINGIDISAINTVSGDSIPSGTSVQSGTNIQITAIPQDTDDDIEVEWTVS